MFPSGSKGSDDPRYEKSLKYDPLFLYQLQFFLVQNQIQPSEFWKMSLESLAGLSYWIDNKGTPQMTKQDLEDLKKRMAKKEKK